jgi:hypothetical protein
MSGDNDAKEVTGSVFVMRVLYVLRVQHRYAILAIKPGRRRASQPA